MFGPEYIDSRTGIVTAVTSKATKYGELDLPYVVAVNIIEDFVNHIDIAEALFGQEQLVVTSLIHGGFKTEHKRKPNGIWFGPSGPKNTRVSAILAIDLFSCWDVAKKAASMWHNPWAQRPLPQTVWPFVQMVGDKNTGRIEVKTATMSPAQVLGLAPEWPIS